MKTGEDAALGALLGALIGDACGGPLEFLGRAPSPAEVESAMTLPGGGYWKLAPGQITDDGELTLALASALADQAAYDSEASAAAYRSWFDSKPFDIGRTLLAAFSGEALDHNSQANGSLMRCVPLGIWGCRLSDRELAALAYADSGLSHPHPNCQSAVAATVLALATLISEPGPEAHARAFERAFAWARRHSDEVADWLDLAREGVRVPFYPRAGHVKIAFTNAFRLLAAAAPYREAVAETLRGGGDTDTNACIAGGLLGALHGAASLPRELVTPLLSCSTKRGRPRPAAYHPRRSQDLVQALLSRSRSASLPRQRSWIRRLFGAS